MDEMKFVSRFLVFNALHCEGMIEHQWGEELPRRTQFSALTTKLKSNKKYRKKRIVHIFTGADIFTSELDPNDLILDQ